MGCCGCDNKTSTFVAAISAIVQCVVGFALSLYHLEVFNSDCSKEHLSGRYYLCYVLRDFNTSVKTMLITGTVLYILWGISSVLLLIGNAKNRYGLVRQWLLLSVIVAISDVILPCTLIGMTFNVVLRNYEVKVYVLVSWDRQEITTRASMENLTWHYLLLIVSLSRAGLITWVIEIALTVYTSHREREIRRPSATQAFIHEFRSSLQSNPNVTRTSLRRQSSSSRMRTLSFKTATTVLIEVPDEESAPDDKTAKQNDEERETRLD